MGTTKATRGRVEITLKDKAYTLLELDLEELGDTENFVKSKYAKLYRQSAEGVDPEQVEKRVLEILKTAYTTDELNKEMTAYDVLYYVIYLMLKHNPGVTRESMGGLVDKSNIGMLVTAMESFQSEEEDSENPPPQAEASP